ncbi:MAG: anthrone oxygenase family protein [Actinophytocola sp.]|uniref:anthrone oxygenase family protein n=1 Tax=Actinophytocola sp. TaxID=1872138 RepID=UPI003C768F35
MVVLTLVVAFVNLVLLGAVFGVFFTYSNSIVPGLDRIDAERAVAAMRGINVAIINPRFLATFILPLVTSAATGFLLLGLDETTPALLYFAAAVLYLIGCHVITGVVNVPLNNALENSTSTDWARRWADFSPRWRRWNTVRTVSSMLALVLCGIGLYLWGD